MNKHTNIIIRAVIFVGIVLTLIAISNKVYANDTIDGVLADYEDVYMVGDSIAYMCTDAIEQKLSNIKTNNIGGRTICTHIFENTSGLEIIYNEISCGNIDADDTIIFALNGNQDHRHANTPDIDTVMLDTLHEIAPTQRIYLITCYDAVNPFEYSNNNNLMIEAAKKYDNWYVIDWASTVANTDDVSKYIIMDDGGINDQHGDNFYVHPTTDYGVELWSDLVAFSLSSDIVDIENNVVQLGDNRNLVYNEDTKTIVITNSNDVQN